MGKGEGFFSSSKKTEGYENVETLEHDLEQAREDAKNQINRAGCMVRIMAILQNPKKICQIISAKNIKENMREHYGTDDPKKVAEMIFLDLRDAIRNGTWSVGRLAFFGGAYACVVGVLDLLPPASLFKIFSPLAGINMVFVLLFGFVIMTIESSGDTISSTFKSSIFHYCKALETVWGRGYFYLYVGTTCFLAPGHKFFGFYMLIIGIIYLIIYRLTTGHIRRMAQIFKEDTGFVKKFEESAGIDGQLTRLEMVHLLKEVDMDMSHAEMEMFFNRLDPNHDGQITLAEMKAVFAQQEEAKTRDYKLSNIPRFDPSKFDLIVTKQRKGVEEEKEEEEDDDDDDGGGGFFRKKKKKKDKKKHTVMGFNINPFH